MRLTREFFEKNGFKKSTIRVENTDAWCAVLKKDINKDGVYIDVTVTNIIYPNRFAISGYFTTDCYITAMLYTESEFTDLMNFVKHYYETI